MTDRLPDGSQTNLMMYRWKGIFLGLAVQEISSNNIMGISTESLADGWINGTDDGHTDGQMEFQVESHLG